jgi:hypothetical protein
MTMKTCTRKYLAQAVACALTVGFTAGVAAQTQMRVAPPADRQVWMDNSRAQVWKNAYGECWQAASGPAPSAGECAPVALVTPAPVAQAPAPAPEPAPLAPLAQAPAPEPAPAPLAAPEKSPEPAPLAPKRDRN